MSIEIPKDKQQRLIGSIRKYFDQNMEEELGDLKAMLLLDFCLKEIGPVIYNQAIGDARAFMTEKVADLDSTCYEPENVYWPGQKKRRK